VSTGPCLTKSEFDTRAFGFPYYRLTRPDFTVLPSELRALAIVGPFAADGKISAGDLHSTHELLRCGFRKICMQIKFYHRLEGCTGGDGISVTDGLGLTEETIWRHARNFSRDRFSLDPFLPAAGRQRLYFEWLRNSLSGSKRVAYEGESICTFSHSDNEVVIDLLSILEPRRGIGTRLVLAVLAEAAAQNARGVRVVTECENAPAWGLYQKLGFSPVEYVSAFHFRSASPEVS
jgi:GNAT superfamily N-acetyltransferase